MIYDEAQERYMKDPEFHQLVDSMVAMMDRLDFTPGEVKQAAVFAAIRFEAMRLGPRAVLTDENV